MISDSTNTASFIIITVILTTIVVGTIVGNFFVITAILIDKNLQTTANQLVLSLAVADLMVACLVMPLGAYNEIYQGWYLSKEVCEFWTSADVLCCTASILNLLAIALDRYWAVTNVDYIYRRTRQRVNVMILCAWTVGAIVSLAPIFGWKDPDFANRVLDEHKCMVSQDVAYQVFATISTFYAPLVLLLALYWRIFQVARKRIRRKPGCNSASGRAKEETTTSKKNKQEELCVARLAEDYALRRNQILLCPQSDQPSASQVPLANELTTTPPNKPEPEPEPDREPSKALIALQLNKSDMGSCSAKNKRDDMQNKNNELTIRRSSGNPRKSNGRLDDHKGEVGCECDWCCCCESCELQINYCINCQFEKKRLKGCQSYANSASEPQINHGIGELTKNGAYLELDSSTLQQPLRRCGCQVEHFAADKKIDKRLSSSGHISPLAEANIDGTVDSIRGLPGSSLNLELNREVAVDLRPNFDSNSDSDLESDSDSDSYVEVGRAPEEELLARMSSSSADDYEELSLSASFPPPIELVTNRKLKRVLGNSNSNGDCKVNYSQTVFHTTKVNLTGKSKKLQTTRQQQHCDKLSIQAQKMYSNNDVEWIKEAQFNSKVTTTDNQSEDNSQAKIIIQSLDLRRKFRVMGQLVSFVQTSKTFNHQNSYSSQSGDEIAQLKATKCATGLPRSEPALKVCTISSGLQLAPQVSINKLPLNESKEPNNKRRENMDMKREKKAAKTLAIITGVFVCCWLPFFLNAIIMPVCGPNCVPNDLILSVLLWLGYLNSLLNPIIYTIFSPDFRLAFRRLLCWPELAKSSRGSMGGKRAY